VTSRPAAVQHLCDLARLRRVQDRIDREYAQPLDVEALLTATPTDSPTGTNLAAIRAVWLGPGHTRDASLIEGEVEVPEIDPLPQQRGDRFAARTGFESRARATPYRWFRISPRGIHAWREVNELRDRELMRNRAGWSNTSAGGDCEGGPA
jgi:hypothetical protein